MRSSLIIAVGALGLAACSGDTGSERRYTEDDVEYKLAALAGESLTDESIERYARALDQAEPVCSESRELIGDIVFAGQESAADLNIETTTLELLRAIPPAVPQGARPTPCADVVASVVLLMR